MKKLIIFLSFLLITGISFGQTQRLKKNFELYKGLPTLYFTGTTPVINFNTGEITITETDEDTLTLSGGVLALPSPPSISEVTMANIFTVSKTIGAIGVTGCDFNFATAANITQQVIDLGTIVPARSRVLDVVMQTDVTWAGTAISAFTCEGGNSSSGAQFFADTDIITAGALAQTAVGAGFTLVAINAAATKVYIGGAPTGGNWSALLAGKATVYVTYITY